MFKKLQLPALQACFGSGSTANIVFVSAGKAVPKNENAANGLFQQLGHAKMTEGRLYIVPTPIGNLEDITLRALRILKESDLIASEDTRQTQKLLAHFDISKTLTSYHDFNKEEKAPLLVRMMKEGKEVALVSDAGTPTISDPGYLLINQAIANGIPVVPLPGASAILTALAGSGLPTDAFIFIGFLPKKKLARTRIIETLKEENRTLIFFETPHRILTVLKELYDILGGGRRVVIARELTKQYEEFIHDTLEGIQNRKWTIKGEITLLIEGTGKRSKRSGHTQGETEHETSERGSSCEN